MVGDLVLGMVGLAGVFAGWCVRIVLCISRVAHEILLRLDDDYDRAYGSDAEGRQEEVISKSDEDRLSFHSLSKSGLRELSTRDLTVGWRLLVMVPLVVGGLLLVLTLGAWQVPRLGNLIFQYGVRLEYLWVGGLMLMMIGAYLMPLGNIVYRRACNSRIARDG